MSHEEDDICEGDERVIGFVEFVIAGINSTKLLDIAKVTFYKITSLIQILTVTPWLTVIFFGGTTGRIPHFFAFARHSSPPYALSINSGLPLPIDFGTFIIHICPSGSSAADPEDNCMRDHRHKQVMKLLLL